MKGKINEHEIVTKKVLSKKTCAVDFLANALGMLKEGMSIEVISRITGLSIKEIEKQEKR